jgi:hypothetical protein
MGNPLINELIIGTGAKDRFSMDQPVNDLRFTNYLQDPTVARVVNALTGGGVAIPAPPRLDLLPLVRYLSPIAAAGTPPGPVADLLRLNIGLPPTPAGSQSRLGLLGGDPAGFPNGRRLGDDVTDIALRVVVGGVLAAPFPGFDPDVNGMLGDGVNVNDVPYRDSFPYLGYAHSGRDRRHVDPGEPPVILDFGPLGQDPSLDPPQGAAAWRLRNPDIGHIDGPYALPGRPNPSGLPVADPCSAVDPFTGKCTTTSVGGFWADIDLCPLIHLHLAAAGHPDPASGPPVTVSACGHGGLEYGFPTP